MTTNLKDLDNSSNGPLGAWMQPSMQLGRHSAKNFNTGGNYYQASYTYDVMGRYFFIRVNKSF